MTTAHLAKLLALRLHTTQWCRHTCHGSWSIHEILLCVWYTLPYALAFSIHLFSHVVVLLLCTFFGSGFASLPISMVMDKKYTKKAIVWCEIEMRHFSQHLNIFFVVLKFVGNSLWTHDQLYNYRVGNNHHEPFAFNTISKQFRAWENDFYWRKQFDMHRLNFSRIHILLALKHSLNRLRPFWNCI